MDEILSGLTNIGIDLNAANAATVALVIGAMKVIKAKVKIPPKWKIPVVIGLSAVLTVAASALQGPLDWRSVVASAIVVGLSSTGLHQMQKTWRDDPRRG